MLPARLDTVVALERAEMLAFADTYRAADAQLVGEGGLSAREFAGAVLIAARQVDVLALNRIIGLGTFEAVSDQTIADLVAVFTDIGSPRFFVPVAPVDGASDLARGLERVGARLYNSWMRLSRTVCDLPPESASDLVVKQITGTSEAGAFGRIVAAGFGYPPSTAALPGRTVGRSGWRHYLAYDHGEPVAAAAMYLADEAAWFGFAATAASHRGRGAQTALIVRRLADAAAAGCSWVSVETAEDTVEKNAPSFRNLRRLGFDVAYKRPNYLWTRDGAET